MIRVKK